MFLQKFINDILCSHMGSTSTEILVAKTPRHGAAPLIESIRKAVYEGRLRHGDRLVPLRQLAKQHAISLGTATSALGQLEREGLIRKLVGNGTFVTFDQSAVAAKQGMPVHLWLALKGHVYQELADALLRLLQHRRIEARTGVWHSERGSEQIEELTSDWKSRPPRALVAEWGFPAVGKIARQGVPAGTSVIVVFGDPQFLPQGWHSVNPDRTAMCRMAVRYLADRGHRRIGFVTYGPTHEVGHPLMNQSRNGEWKSLQILAMRLALREKELTNALSIHYQVDGQAITCLSSAKPNTEVLRWLNKPNRPTAVVGDDWRLMTIKHTAEQMGLRVPQDLELLGFGDTPWSQAGRFNSISYSPELIAREVVELIDTDPNKLNGVARHVTVMPKLVIR